MTKEFSTWDKKSIKTIVGKTKDFDELAKDCVAFANFKGGHIHIGIEDDEELPPQGQTIPNDIAETTVKRLNELTINVGISHKVVESENGAQYLDLHIYPSRSSVASTTNGRYFMRDNDKSRPLMPDELIRLIGDKSSYCWETKQTLNVSMADADQQKVQSFVNKIRQSDRVTGFVKEKTERELLEHYLLIDENGQLTNLGVLWIGKRMQRARLLYSPVVQYIKYDENGDKVFKKIWDDYEFNPEELLENIWNSVPEWRESNEVSEGLWRANIPAFDEKVVREVLANAIVHRPYTTRGDVFINMFPDRMEIVNPGQLPYGVTVSTILHKSIQRNEHMSKIFYDLHMMEREGSGYDLIFDVLLSWGKDLPVVIEGEDYVKVVITRKIVDKEAYRIHQYLEDNYSLSQKARIAFGIILQQKKIKSLDLSKCLQLNENERLRDYLKTLLAEKIVLSSGTKKSTTYSINPKIVQYSKANITTTLKTIEPYRLKALIEEDLKYHPNSTVVEISNRLPDVEFLELQKMVRSMAHDGELANDSGRKFRRYWKP